jgi:hypothetical protein
MRYAADKAESIAAKLRALPPKQKEHDLNRRDMVNVLAKELHELQKRGYTLEEIGETLRGEGFDIATPTLRTYLHSNPHSKKRRQKAQTTPGETQKAKPAPKVEATAPRTEGKKAEEGAGKGRFTVRPDTVDI